MFFVIFQQLEMKKKKKKGNEIKNVGAEIGNGLLPKLCSDQGARQLGVGCWAQAHAERPWARRRRRTGVRGMARRGAKRRRARGRTQRGARQGRAGRVAGARRTQAWARPGRCLGVLLGQWAVHLVHSACFDPV